MTTEQRFWAKVGGEFRLLECWPWRASFNTAGYGQFWLDSKMIHAHRISYELMRGKIPTGLELDHLCRNRACQNPWHMEAVTKKINLLRGYGTGAIHARQTHCMYGHPFSKENTYIAKGKRYCLICMKKKDKKRYEENKEQIDARHRQYFINNKKRINECQRQRYAKKKAAVMAQPFG